MNIINSCSINKHVSTAVGSLETFSVGTSTSYLQKQ